MAGWVISRLIRRKCSVAIAEGVSQYPAESALGVLVGPPTMCTTGTLGVTARDRIGLELADPECRYHR